jgi:hypothetical protein
MDYLIDFKHQITEQEWEEFVQDYERWVLETQQDDFLVNQKN